MKIPSVKELHAMTAKPSEKKKSAQKKVIRYISTCITRILLYTPATANQVTTFMIFLGIFASVLFAFSSQALSIAGALLLYIWILLDHVDGQVARFRKVTSYKGYFLDYMSGYITEATLFLFISIGVYKDFPSLLTIICGLMTVACIPLYRVVRDSRYALHSSFVLKHGKKFEKGYKVGKALTIMMRFFEKEREKPTFFFNLFKISHLVFIFAILDMMHILFFAYAIMYPLRLAVVISYQYSEGTPFVNSKQ